MGRFAYWGHLGHLAMVTAPIGSVIAGLNVGALAHQIGNLFPLKWVPDMLYELILEVSLSRTSLNLMWESSWTLIWAVTQIQEVIPNRSLNTVKCGSQKIQTYAEVDACIKEVKGWCQSISVSWPCVVPYQGAIVGVHPSGYCTPNVRIDHSPQLEPQVQERELNPEPGFPWAYGPRDCLPAFFWGQAPAS
ncbi:hypothetical protein DSO57_1028431 [Entomophthora muscae]|uniref:Uncharacterized protein n=1 Tax=Entomophthora muscae TaxID=34485 RepID=A0ACC2TNI0_9FUNG|nr:hypothetical protein DSO57_1028431 [Entomophthora muscae]